MERKSAAFVHLRVKSAYSLLEGALPLSVPGLVAGGLLAFIMTWNNFLFAFLLTSTAEVKTLPVIMRQFALGEPAVWGVSAAGALISTLPVALTSGAVKG